MQLPVRLAIISTPRTGSNWLQHLLSRLYELERLSPANPANVSWPRLPHRCVLILHWPREAGLLGDLCRHGFKVVSLARHPLDVLLSILRFTLREPTDGWLQGEGGNERAILGLTPRSPGFLDWASSPRAAALLAITRTWWADANCHKVRYEELVANPRRELRRLARELGLSVRGDIARAVSGTTLESLRRDFPQRRHHFWQGKPGLWQQLLPAAEANVIARAQAVNFTELGYVCDPLPALTAQQADAAWLELLGLRAGANPTLDSLQQALFDVKKELEQTRARLKAHGEVGPRTLTLARTLTRLARPFASLATLLRSVWATPPAGRRRSHHVSSAIGSP